MIGDVNTVHNLELDVNPTDQITVKKRRETVAQLLAAASSSCTSTSTSISKSTNTETITTSTSPSLSTDATETTSSLSQSGSQMEDSNDVDDEQIEQVCDAYCGSTRDWY